MAKKQEGPVLYKRPRKKLGTFGWCTITAIVTAGCTWYATMAAVIADPMIIGINKEDYNRVVTIEKIVYKEKPRKYEVNQDVFSNSSNFD